MMRVRYKDLDSYNIVSVVDVSFTKDLYDNDSGYHGFKLITTLEEEMSIPITVLAPDDVAEQVMTGLLEKGYYDFTSEWFNPLSNDEPDDEDEEYDDCVVDEEDESVDEDFAKIKNVGGVYL